MIPRVSPPSAILGNLALGLALIAGAGCGGEAPRDGVAARAPAGGRRPSTKSYPLVGVVREVKAESGLVTIRHQAIPGFMDAMTMPFPVKDRGVLDDLRPGDEVEGTLRVVSERGVVKDYELVDLQVTRPAPAPKMTPGPLRGTAQLRPAPQVAGGRARPSPTSP